MPPYSVEFLRSARKEFERLPAKIRQKVVDALSLLAVDPYSELLKVKKMKGFAHLFRIRIGDYRVLYEVRGERLLIVIIKVGHRSEIYRDL